MKTDLYELLRYFSDFQGQYLDSLENAKTELGKCLGSISHIKKRAPSGGIMFDRVASIDSSFKSVSVFLSRVCGILVTVSDVFSTGTGERDSSSCGAFFTGYDQSTVDSLLRGLSIYFEVFEAARLLEKVDRVMLDRRITSALIGVEQAVSVASKVLDGEDETQDVYEVSDYLIREYSRFIDEYIKLVESGRAIFTSKVSKSVELVNYINRVLEDDCRVRHINDYELSYLFLSDGEYVATDVDMSYGYVPGQFLFSSEVREKVNRVVELARSYKSVFLNVWGRVYKFETLNPDVDSSFIYNSFAVQNGNEFPFLDMTDREAKANLKLFDIYIPAARV